MSLEAVDRAFVEQYYVPNRKQSEVVIYYRRPNNREWGNANWIVWADSQLNKLAIFQLQGYEPLFKYGPIGRANCHYDSAEAWAPILNHPDGPAEFPVDQILSYRWHDPAFLPKGVRKDIVFPQLEGLEIIEYDCIECDHKTFRQAIHLARHLRNAHDYDRAEIMALGERLGIDFTKEFAPKSRRTTVYHAGDRQSTARSADGEAAAPRYTVQKAPIPSREELQDEPAPKRSRLSPEARAKAAERMRLMNLQKKAEKDAAELGERLMPTPEPVEA